MTEEREFDVEAFRENLQVLRQNLREGLGLRKRRLIERLQAIRPLLKQREEAEVERSAIVAKEVTAQQPQKQFDVSEEYDYSKGCWLRIYRDKADGRVVKVEEIYDRDAAAPSTERQVEVAEQLPQPKPARAAPERLVDRLRSRGFPVIDSLRGIFEESRKQVELKTRREQLQLSLLEKQLRGQEEKHREKEKEGTFY